RVLDLVPVLGQQRPEPHHEGERAERLEDLARITEVGLAVLHHASERLEGLALRLERRRHPPADRHATRRLAPRHAHASEVAALRKAAGLRSEPPVPLPSAMGTMPHASATAAPPMLPPQVFVTSYGFSVRPKTSLKVCEPAPNSGVLVLPSVTAPAARSRSMI